MFNSKLKSRVRFLEAQMKDVLENQRGLEYRYHLLLSYLGIYERRISEHIVMEKKGGPERNP